jgi:Short C-terminal domain/Phospholipase_D-nuclease N-terminal
MDVLWSMVIFFCWVVWIWMMIVILTNVFQRRDIGGWAKALWTVFMIVLPFLGALIYLITQHDEMIATQQEQAQVMRKQLREEVGIGSASEIEKAKGLLDSGTISQAEFDQIKAKALAA